MNHAAPPAAPSFAPSPERVRLLRKIHGAAQVLGLALWPALFISFGLLADRHQRSLPDGDLVQFSTQAGLPHPVEAANIGLSGISLLILLSIGMLLGLLCYYANRCVLQTLSET